MSDNEHMIPAPTMTQDEEEDIIEEKDLALRDEVDAEIAQEIAAELPPPPQPLVHVMTDLETWGNGNKALPVSLGAVAFNETEILREFHVGIDPVSGQLFKLEIDADTIMWWFDPERDEARREWLKLEKVDLASALVGFSAWLAGGPPVAAIWGNGSTFDNVILRSAYEATGLEYPVRFWQDQCYRSIKNRTPDIKIERTGTHHNALDDARSQARHLQAILKQLNAPLSHLEKMQNAAAAYLETPPGDDAAKDEFIAKMIELLDGPEQREATASRIAL